MSIKIRWNRPLDDIARSRAGGDKGLLFLANEAKRLMDPYVPAQNMVLAQNVRVYVKEGAGHVHYQSPYAHYQYEGVLYVSSRTGSAWASRGEFKVKADPEKKLVQNKFRHRKELSGTHRDGAGGQLPPI